MRPRRRGRTGSRMSCCREQTSQWECNVGVLSVTICEPNTNCPTHTHERQSTVEHAQHPFTRTRRASVGSVQSDYTQNKPRPVFSTYLRHARPHDTPPVVSRRLRYTSRTRFVTASRNRSDAGPCAARVGCPAAVAGWPLARGQTPRELRSSRRSEGSVRVRYPTVPPNPPLTYPLPLIPVFELVAHEIDSDRTSRALRPP